MFDLDRFSLARFSLGSEDSSIPVADKFFESMNSSAGASVPVAISAQFNEGFNRIVQGTISIGLDFIAEESLSAACTPSARILTRMVQAASIHSKINAIKTLLVFEMDSVVLNNKAFASKNILERLRDSSSISSNIHAAKDVEVKDTLSDTLMSSFEAINQVLKSTTIQVSIPPGGELRIDSGSYTVTLDGENILYAQVGDWVKMKPNLFRIDVETTEGGDLDGSVIYTEKYL